MKRIISIFLAVTMLFTLCTGLNIEAFALEYGEFTYDLVGKEDENKTAVITGYTGDSGVVTIPRSVTGGIVVTGIDDNAMMFLRIGTVIIPSSVITIGEGAFCYCFSIDEVTFTEGSELKSIGNNAFNSTKLKEIELPSGLEEIGNGVFAECSSLTTVYLPDSVTSIGSEVFSDCTSLTKISYAGTKCQWDNITKGSDNDFSALVYEKGEHSYVPTVTEPTCTESGYTTYVCEYCGGTYTSDETEPLGHDFSEWSETEAAIAPTCTETGKTAVEKRTCSRCEFSETRGGEKISALGHDWGEWTETEDEIPATCTETGVTGGEKRVCANDPSHIETRGGEVIPVNPDNHTNIVQDEAVPATCSQTGLTAGSHCADCGTVIVAHTETPMLEHDWDDGTVTTESTCQVKGTKTYHCKNCTATKEEQLPLSGHKAVTVKAVPATYWAAGRTQYSYCQYCKSYIVKPQTIAKLVLATPGNFKVTGGKKSITVKYNRIGCASGYVIQYSTTKNFAKGTAKLVYVNNGATTSKVISGLKKNKTYYVRVYAYRNLNGKTAISRWTAVKSAKTKK